MATRFPDDARCHRIVIAARSGQRYNPPKASCVTRSIQVKPTAPAPRLASAQPQAWTRDHAHADVVRLVRDALRHLHDPVSLRTHPLTDLFAEPDTSPSVKGKRLHQLLLEAIAALRPESSSNDARALRRHDLLTLRYIEALEIDTVAARLGMSRREFTRQQRYAFEAVAAFLEDTAALPRSPRPLPSRSPAPKQREPNRLPLSVSSFIGREQELAAVRHLLDAARLVTLTGPPGTGKTRLAVQLAAAFNASSSDHDDGRFADGVSFVPLASIADPELVPSAIAQTLEMRGVSDRSPIASLEDLLSHRHALLILDNFEHVLAAVPVVSQLLASCPHLTVLATSRAALRLSGEHEFAVPPLQVPEDRGPVRWEEIADCEAVRLYVERAAAMQSGFHLTDQNAPAVAELCRRLDGLPLAIELAAARSRLFPAYALLARLSPLGQTGRPGDQTPRGSTLALLNGGARDLPSRQQTLRNAIAWSYRLLTRDEQRLFARLSVFAGGWTLEAAEAVCAGGVGENLEVVDGMASLVDKSLVQRGDEMRDAEAPRFSLLETIREYAREQFEELGEGAGPVPRRHAAYFLAFAREADAHYWGPEQSPWQKRLHQELANLRAALAWAKDNGEDAIALQLAGSLRMFWFDSGLRSEGRAWLESVLQRAPASGRTADRAAALIAAGDCNWLLGDFAAARAQFEESLRIWHELGDRRGRAWALHELAVIATEQGDETEARLLTEEALSLARAVGERPLVALALHGLSLAAVRHNDKEAAYTLIEESRQVWRELGDREHLALTSNTLGDLARASGQYEEATRLYQESLDLIGQEGPQGWRALYLHNLGHAKGHLGDERQARALFAEALSRYRDIGDRRGVLECVAGLASLIADRDPERTARLLGAATAVADAMGTRLSQLNRTDYDNSLATARRRLGDEAFEAAWRQGRSLSQELAITYALEEC